MHQDGYRAGQDGTSAKWVSSNVRYTGGNGCVSQTAAFVESSSSNTGHAIGNGDAG